MRRVSVNPWTNREIAATELEDKYIYSWKPNPASVINGSEEGQREDVRKTLEIAEGCKLEVILKDTHTVAGHPEKISRWIQLAREEIENCL